MAEIILPPEEETPETPELDIDKPTENSKVITIEFEAKKTNKVSTKDTNQQLYTTDTDAWFEFKETSLEGANGTYSVVFRNRHDGSIFQRTGDVVNGVAYYKIPHQEIRHAGAWRGQLVYTLENGNTTAREFGYDVKGHILDGKDVREIVVEDFETLMSQLNSMKDNAEQELAELVNTANQNETDRQAFFDDLVEDIDELQSAFEANEAQRELAESERALNEQSRESAESERVANEAERISKDSERDSKIEAVEGVIDDVSSKIDSKANKSMLLSPKYDLVYDSCVRDVDTPLDAYSVPMESGHYFENVKDRDSDTTLTYEPDGVLLARPSVRNSFSPILIAGFDVDSPYFEVRAKHLNIPNDARFWFIKYKDKDNWVGIRLEGAYQEIRVVATVEGIQTAIAEEDVGGSVGERQARPSTIYSLKAEIVEVHLNFAESARALRVFKNEQWVLTVPIPTNSVDFPNRVGFSVGSRTEMLNFKAGRSS